MEDPRLHAAEELCRTIAGFYSRGWCLGTSGNFSVRLQGNVRLQGGVRPPDSGSAEEPLRLLITPSGIDKGRVTPEDLLVVDAGGEPVGGGAGKPSAETLLHVTAALEAGAGATLHTHSVAATLLGEHFLPAGGLTLTGYEMLKGLSGVGTHEAEVHVPVVPNSQDMRQLAGRMRDELARRPGLQGLLLAGHGLYTWGLTLDEARRHVEAFEFLFECVVRRTAFSPFPGPVSPRGGS